MCVNRPVCFVWSTLVTSVLTVSFMGYVHGLSGDVDYQWEADVYFGMRQDMHKLGLIKNLLCPINLPSGIHSILMAFHMCNQVSICSPSVGSPDLASCILRMDCGSEVCPGWGLISIAGEFVWVLPQHANDARAI